MEKVGGITVKKDYEDFVKYKKFISKNDKITKLDYFDRMYDFRYMLFNNKLSSFYKRNTIYLKQYGPKKLEAVSGEVLMSLSGDILITLGIFQTNTFRKLYITEDRYNELKKDQVILDHYNYLTSQVKLKCVSKHKKFDIKFITFLSLITSVPDLFINTHKYPEKSDFSQIIDFRFINNEDKPLHYSKYSPKLYYELIGSKNYSNNYKKLEELNQISIKWIDINFNIDTIGVISKDPTWQEIYILKILRNMVMNGRIEGLQLLQNWIICKEDKLQIGLVSKFEGNSLNNIPNFLGYIIKEDKDFFKNILYTLYTLSNTGIIHGDLHLGNICPSMYSQTIVRNLVVGVGDASIKEKDMYNNTIKLPKYTKHFRSVSKFSFHIIDFGLSILHKELISHFDCESEEYQVLMLQKRRITNIYKYMFPDFFKKNEKKIEEALEDYPKMFNRIKAVDMYKLCAGIIYKCSNLTRESEQFKLINKYHNICQDQLLFINEPFDDINYTLLSDYKSEMSECTSVLHANAPLTYSFSDDLKTFPPHMRNHGSYNTDSYLLASDIFLKMEKKLQEGKEIDFTEFTKDDFDNLKF